MAKSDAPAQQATLRFALVVIHPFGDHKRGDRIEDAEAIAQVLKGENAHHCHKVDK